MAGRPRTEHRGKGLCTSEWAELSFPLRHFGSSGQRFRGGKAVCVTRILSGILPTGEIHLGNYLGALRHWVTRQADAECLFLIADLHAITTPQDPGELRKRTWETATLMLSLGIDPKHSILFLQSQVRYHGELAWVLNCLTRVGELRRMVQFKDKESRRDEAGDSRVVYLPRATGRRYFALSG